ERDHLGEQRTDVTWCGTQVSAPLRDAAPPALQEAHGRQLEAHQALGHAGQAAIALAVRPTGRHHERRQRYPSRRTGIPPGERLEQVPDIPAHGIRVDDERESQHARSHTSPARPSPSRAIQSCSRATRRSCAARVLTTWSTSGRNSASTNPSSPAGCRTVRRWARKSVSSQELPEYTSRTAAPRSTSARSRARYSCSGSTTRP